MRPIRLVAALLLAASVAYPLAAEAQRRDHPWQGRAPQAAPQHFGNQFRGGGGGYRPEYHHHGGISPGAAIGLGLGAAILGGALAAQPYYAPAPSYCTSYQWVWDGYQYQWQPVSAPC